MPSSIVSHAIPARQRAVLLLADGADEAGIAEVHYTHDVPINETYIRKNAIPRSPLALITR